MIQQGDLVEVEIEDVSSEGKGIARIEQQVVFIPNTVTGDRISSRIVRVKKNYGEGKLEQLKHSSPHRIRPRCIVADKCGGCQWQHINYPYQLQIKQKQVQETLTRIGGFKDLPLEEIISGDDLAYRNKVSYPLARANTGQIKAGYYRQGSHQIVNINQCPIQDKRLNPLLAEIKQDLQQLPIAIYEEKNHQGGLRHLCFRIGQNTGEILLTLVSAQLSDDNLEKQAQTWMKRYPCLVGVTLNYNPQKTNVIFGQKTELLAGRPYLVEKFSGLSYHLRAETFFQVNTTVAEKLLTTVLNQLPLTGNETILDLYCGVGTFTLPFAQKVKKAIGVESYHLSILQAQKNAEINQIDNVEFISQTTETFLPTLEIKPDIVILDPPRKGCQEEVIQALKQIKPNYIVYISCHPATLARDLQLLCQEEDYHIQLVQPADFFPQTPHVETVVILQKL